MVPEGAEPFVSPALTLGALDMLQINKAQLLS